MRSKLLVVAAAEYARLVKRRSFLVATLGMPLLIGVIMAASILIATRSATASQLFGVVDPGGFLAVGDLRTAAAVTDARFFGAEAAARAALESGAIQAYYVLPADYPASTALDLYYWEKSPSETTQAAFYRLLSAGLVARAPAAMQPRLAQGVQVEYQTLRAGSQSVEQQVLGFVLPLVIGMFFIFVVMASAGFLLQAVTTEKENRMVEVMFTSVSPGQLIGGKAVGLLGVALTQIGVWLLALVAAVLVMSQRVPFLQELRLDGAFVGWMALFFLPTYALIAGLMIALGSLVADHQQAQQLSSLVTLPFMLPFFFMVLVFTSPNSPLLVALTLFPPTAFTSVAMRWGMTAIPIWQLVLSWVLLVATALASIAFAARVFRLGMLRYGQGLKLGELAQRWGKVRSARAVR